MHRQGLGPRAQSTADVPGWCCHNPNGQLSSSLEDVHRDATDVATCSFARSGATTHRTSAVFGSDTRAASSRDRGPDQPQRCSVRTRPRPRVFTAPPRTALASYPMGLSHHEPLAQRRQSATNGGVQVVGPVLPPARPARRSGRPRATSKPAAQNQPSRRTLEQRGCGLAPVLPPGPRRLTDGRSLTAPVVVEPRGAPTTASKACAPSTTVLTAGRIGSQLTRTEPVGLRPIRHTTSTRVPLGAAPARCCHQTGTTKRARSSRREKCASMLHPALERHGDREAIPRLHSNGAGHPLTGLSGSPRLTPLDTVLRR